MNHYSNTHMRNNTNDQHDWSFQSNNITHNEQPLQEPVAFEDFQFSLGLDPEFALPIPLNVSPPPPFLNEQQYDNMYNNMVEPAFVVPTPGNNALLDEHDHKAFSQFLDQFCVDPNMQMDMEYNTSPPQIPLDHHHHHRYRHYEEDEYHRQNNILRSLDEQKRHFIAKPDVANSNTETPSGVYLQSSKTISAPYIKPIATTSDSNSSHSSRTLSSSQSNHAIAATVTAIPLSPTTPTTPNSGGAIRRSKPQKELLTEEEKRSNHIASEQKRRSMIRSGFKDLTELVPTLKNVNNSKSAVLFKAVDYIKYLEKRNKNLRDKVKGLEVRAEVEDGVDSRMGTSSSRELLNDSNDSSATVQQQQYDSGITHNNMVNTALLQHKTQQRQLIELQEKLELHQKKMAQQQQQQQLYQNQQQHPTQQQQQPGWGRVISRDTNKMEVDTTTTNGEPLIKATVSA